MTIPVELKKIRATWVRAKKAFAMENPGHSRLTFWKSFGDAHNMECVIEEYKHGFAVIETIIFKDEPSYAWFLLRWS